MPGTAFSVCEGLEKIHPKVLPARQTLRKDLPEFMNASFRHIVLLLLCLIAGSQCFGQLSTVYVDAANGSDIYTGANPTNTPTGTGPKATIHAGLGAVANNGTIVLMAGVYAGDGVDTDGSPAFTSDNADIDISSTKYPRVTSGLTIELRSLGTNNEIRIQVRMVFYKIVFEIRVRGFPYHAVRAAHPEHLIDFFVIRADHAAFDRRHVMGKIVGEVGNQPETPEFPSLKSGAVGFADILDQGNVPFLKFGKKIFREAVEALDIGHKYSLGIRGQLLDDLGIVHAKRSRVDIGKHGFKAALDDGGDIRNPGERRDNDLPCAVKIF